MRLYLALACLVFLALGARCGPPSGGPDCTVERVIDGDTFVCDGGTRVRMLQINTIEIDDCGGAVGGRRARARSSFARARTCGSNTTSCVRTATAASWPPRRSGTDGEDYNVSIVMVYVGLAKAAYYGDNAKYLDWAQRLGDVGAQRRMEHVGARRPVQRWMLRNPAKWSADALVRVVGGGMRRHTVPTQRTRCGSRTSTCATAYTPIAGFNPSSVRINSSSPRCVKPCVMQT